MTDVHCNPLVLDQPVEFTVLRVPFFLEPDYNDSPSFHESNEDRLKRKWGAQWGLQKQRHGLKERGRAVGIEHFNLQRLASNTRLSHRLVQYVTHQYGCTASEALYTQINHNHFVLGQKLNDMDMLLDAATVALGTLDGDTLFDREAAHLFLKDKQSGTQVLDNVKEQLDLLGIHSIPAFIIDGNYMVGGAAHTREFVGVFRQLERTPNNRSTKSMFGETLGFSKAVLNGVLDLNCDDGCSVAVHSV